MSDKSSTKAAEAPPNWLRRQCPVCGLFVTGVVADGEDVAEHGCVRSDDACFCDNGRLLQVYSRGPGSPPGNQWVGCHNCKAGIAYDAKIRAETDALLARQTCIPTPDREPNPDYEEVWVEAHGMSGATHKSKQSERTPRIYTRASDRPGALELWRKGERIGSVFSAEDRAGRFFAWNVFFGGRFGGSSQYKTRPATLSAAMAACRAWVKKRTTEDAR